MNTELWERWDMLPRETRVLCALSGGADSVCLAHLLKSLEDTLGIRVYAAHYEHGLRGEESLRDLRFVEGWCRAQGIPLVTERADVRAYAERKRMNLEEAARELRYAFLERCADELGCTRIATAHNADDNAETVLLHLVRGSGARGLSGIPPRRGRLIRPLLETTRAEIEDYLRRHALPHVEDSSNRDERFSRNRLRARVLPALREINPAACAAIGRAAELARRDEKFLDGLAADWLRENGAEESIPALALASLDEALAARVLRRFCGAPLDARSLDAALRFARGSERARLDLPGVMLRRELGRLRCGEAEDEPPDFERALPDEGLTPIPELGLRLRTTVEIYAEREIYSQFKTYWLDYEKISSGLLCTPPRPGDRFRPAGRGVSKSLKALFLENKMPRAARCRALVFRDGTTVAAAHPFAVDERYRPRAGMRALKIRIEQETEKP